MELALETIPAAERIAVCKALRVSASLEASSASSSTSSTTEVALATLAVPAGALGPNGYLTLDTQWSYPNNANVKNLRVRLGSLAGPAVLSVAVSTTVQANYRTRIRNVNSQTAQKVFSPGTTGTSSAGLSTATIDTAAAWQIVITGQVANAADALTLEGYQLEAVYRPS